MAYVAYQLFVGARQTCILKSVLSPACVFGLL